MITQFKSFGFSDPGRTRGLNEESYLCNAKERLFLVADGMGGHASGDRASRTAVEVIEDYVVRSRSGDRTWPLLEFQAELTPSQNRLVGGLLSVNRKLIEIVRKDPSLKGMGTTLVGTIIDEDRRLAIVNAGDSRLYGIRGGKIKQYTTDHTIVGEEEREGRLSREEARRHPQRHILTSGLGINQKPRIDSFLVDIEPKDLTATILFTDIIGFSRLAEQMPPREKNMILNQYFTRMTDVVFKYDGMLDKYVGDGLMAVFGAPMEKDDDAERAIRAALEMRCELVSMMDRMRDDRKFKNRIGINTGRVVAGNIGSPRRMDYTVIGDPVNISSRLESIAGPNQILIGEETYNLVKGKFKINKVGPKRVKGKIAEVLVYEILG